MLQRIFAVSTLCLGLVSSVSAGVITYAITANTTSITGTVGSIDFQFNPGALITQAANVEILNFASDGSLGVAIPTGDVTGTLPGTLQFDNLTVFNDYLTGFTYGTTLSFDVYLFGPALTAPDHVSTSGSTFGFGMYSDNLGTVPVLTTNTSAQFVVTVGVNLDGTTTLTNISDQTTANAVTPEPATFALMGLGFGVFGGARRMSRRRSANAGD